MERQDYKGAEQLLRQALGIYLSNFGPEHLRVANLKRILGECLIKQKNFGEAESLLLESNRVYKA